MKIAVVYKWARDPEAASVRSDGTVDYRGAKMTVLEDDPAALEAAKSIASDSDEIVGVCIGDGDASWILARGVKDTFSVNDAPSLNDQAVAAKIVAAAIKQIGGVDVVVIGDSLAYPVMAASLGAELGFKSVFNLSSAKAENGAIVATRHIGTAEQTITLNVPVLLGFSAQADEKSAPGMKEMLMARKRPTNMLSVSALGVDISEKFSITSSKAPQEKHATLFDGDAVAATQKLVEALKKEGVL
ncbi:hypothetical protein [Campylobacter sp.]|uniref:hypothetical protein n=1 Tax=Campylobacter sp. TaxID=205 RepID=UPI002908E086|nr:hypothetical protein [Campylobacter sp.]MDU6828394.1 hypothetical protein [Campylobacter sp.]